MIRIIHVLWIGILQSMFIKPQGQGFQGLDRFKLLADDPAGVDRIGVVF